MARNYRDSSLGRVERQSRMLLAQESSDSNNNKCIVPSYRFPLPWHQTDNSVTMLRMYQISQTSAEYHGDSWWQIYRPAYKSNLPPPPDCEGEKLPKIFRLICGENMVDTSAAAGLCTTMMCWTVDASTIVWATVTCDLCLSRTSQKYFSIAQTNYTGVP